MRFRENQQRRNSARVRKFLEERRKFSATKKIQTQSAISGTPVLASMDESSKKKLKNLLLKTDTQKEFNQLLKESISLRKKQVSALEKQAALELRSKRQQEAKNQKQADFINNLKKEVDYEMRSNTLLRESSASAKNNLKQQLLLTRNRREFNRALRVGLADIRAANREEKELLKTMQKKGALQSRFDASLKQMVFGIGSAYTAASALQSVLSKGTDYESIRKVFLAVSKNTEEAAYNLSFARKTAVELGMPILDSMRAYAKFVATMGNKMTTNEIEGLYTSIGKMGIALGSTSEDIKGIVKAFNDMASKGTLSMEEVKQQLGDRGVPAVKMFTEAAQKAGVVAANLMPQEAESQFIKLVSEGKVLATQVFPELIHVMNGFAENNNALAKAMNENLGFSIRRLNNDLTDMALTIFDHVKPAFKRLTDGLHESYVQSNSLVSGFSMLFTGIANFFSFISNFAVAVIVDLSNAFSGLIGLTTDVFGDDLGSKIKEFTGGMTGFAAAAWGLFRILKMIFNFTPAGRLFKGFKLLMKPIRWLLNKIPSLLKPLRDLFNFGVSKTPTKLMKMPSAAKIGFVSPKTLLKGTMALGGAYGLHSSAFNPKEPLVTSPPQQSVPQAEVKVILDDRGVNDLMSAQVEGAFADQVDVIREGAM